MQGYGGNSVYIQVKFPEEQEERFVEIAERIPGTAELIPVVLAEPAPAEFSPFAVG
ncbi:MAG: hypothetical protein IJJ99_04540 [Oscillospiraceae bacterium]|nr:hypothetical protein [Oscillospiraceae bacterium]